MTLSGLFIYPVKSLRGLSVATAEVDELGLVGDRRFMVVDQEGRFLTQRVLPRMALITTDLRSDVVVLSAVGADKIEVARISVDPNAPRPVTIWASEGLQAEDCGDAVAGWLSNFLRVACRLVRAGAAFQRPVLKPGKARPGDQVSFADAYPFLILSEASLADLNHRLGQKGDPAVSMDRFRPNLLVNAGVPYAEDTWPAFRIGQAVFRAAGGCVRCAVTTTDQQTAAVGKEPLRTLATYRRNPAGGSGVVFGQNLLHETKAGRLSVGDTVEILAR